MVQFYWPWFALLLLLPFLMWYLPPDRKKNLENSTTELLFPALDRLKSAFPSFNVAAKKQHAQLALLSLIWVCLVLSVMRPQSVDQHSYVKNQGYDLMLAVDISGSMRALDFSTTKNIISRLDITKDVVGRFVGERRGDRVGLILFGENAYLHVPLTLDTFSVGQMLNNAVSGMAGDATAIGDAIGLAVRNLRERPEGSRVIVLLTDGDDTASSIPPIEAAKLAKQYGIRIYTIGVGKEGLVPYPDDRGGVVMVHMSMDEALLQNIAKTTGGNYFNATNAQALQKIYDKINALEKTQAEVKEYLIRRPLYHYPLSAAAVLLLILCLTPLYRRVAYGV